MIGRLRSDLTLTASFLRHGGVPRAAMVALCTCVVAGLLLVAVAVLLYGATVQPGRPERFSDLVDQPDLRAGYLVALLLICVAPLTLLRQVLRLGTTTREQRLAALRLAGATPGDVRRLGALEVGVPALAGGLLGYVVYRFLGLLLGEGARAADGSSSRMAALRLVPTGVGLDGWHVVAVAVVLGLAGALAGATTGRALVVSPVGVSRRAPQRPPRPWGLLLVMAGVLAGVAASTSQQPEVLLLVAPTLLVVGVLSLAPFVAYQAGRLVAAAASSPALLVAGRRLAADARPAGRAAAAVGAIGLVAGYGALLTADLPDTTGGGGFAQVDAFYVVPLVLVGVVLVVALVLVVFSLAVHQVESLTDQRRSLAALAVLGFSRDDLERTSRWEIALAAVPMASLGVLLSGGLGAVVLLANGSVYAVIPAVVSIATIALVVLAVLVSTWLTRPWLVRAASPDNLRTP